ITNGADGKPVSWGAVYYNAQENYLELSSLSVAGNQVSTLISLGLMQAQAEIRYKNGTSLSPGIAAATGWQTAFLLNESYRDAQVGAGVRSMSTPELSVTFDSRYGAGAAQGGDDAPLHPVAKQLLKPLERIAIA